MMQQRTFILTNEPRLKYYKNETIFRVSILTFISSQILCSREKLYYQGKCMQGGQLEIDSKQLHQIEFIN